MSQSPCHLIFGTYPLHKYPSEQLPEFFKILQRHNITQIDTASVYKNSEQILGQLGTPKDFTIHTKAASWFPGRLARKPLISGVLFSLYELKVDSVDILFLHSPDTETPLEETLSAVNELYLAGKFKRFGISNFLPEQVEQVISIATENKWILPSVYQGNYNPVARRTEDTLFPLLRKHGLSFFAYSPLSGGFLTKDANVIREGVPGGRFDKDDNIGKIYHTLYSRPKLLAALEKWDSVAKAAGVTRAALSYRWVAYHSALKRDLGDGMIVGASRPAQLEETLKAVEDGPLPETAVEAIEEIWEEVKDEAPLDNFNTEV